MNLFSSRSGASSKKKMKHSLSRDLKTLDYCFATKNSSIKLSAAINHALAAFILGVSSAQAAGPVGGVVQSGTATITSSQNGQSTTIVQTTP